MANTPRVTPPTSAPDSAPQVTEAQTPETGASTSELVANTPDDRDNVEVRDTQKTEGRRFRAIPTHGGTTVGVSRQDFEALKIDHDSVVFDFRKGNFTLEVGEEISEEAAKALHKHEPTRFEFIGG